MGGIVKFSGEKAARIKQIPGVAVSSSWDVPAERPVGRRPSPVYCQPRLPGLNAMRTCPNCTAAVHELASFCPSCGSEFYGEGVVSRETEPPPPVQPYRPWVWALSGGGFLFFLCLLLACFVAMPTLLMRQQRLNAVMAVPAAPTAPVPTAPAPENNLRQIGLAMHNYHDVHAAFPAGGIVDDQGEEYHSWQTALLPFLGYVNYYANVQRNLPWNAPENQWAFSETIPEYLNPQIPITMNADAYALSHYAGNSLLFKENVFTKMSEITDGTTNTIVAGEIVDGFPPWAYPRNVRNPAAGIKGDNLTFGGPQGNGAFFLKADGSVVFISNTADSNVLKAMSTPADGDSMPETPKPRIPPAGTFDRAAD